MPKRRITNYTENVGHMMTTGLLIQAIRDRDEGNDIAPIIMRIEAFGQKTGGRFVKNQRLRFPLTTDKNIARGTGNGGLVIMDPEVDLTHSPDFIPNLTTSTSYFMVASRAAFGAGTPDETTGSIKNGYSWKVDSSFNLIFSSHSITAVKTNAVQFTAGGQIIFFDATGFGGTLTHSITTARVWTFPDATGRVTLNNIGTGLFNDQAVPFAAATGLLEQDSGFQFDNITDTLKLGIASSTNGILLFRNATNANLTGLRAGVATSSVTYILPLADGTNHQVMKTDGSAALGFDSYTRAQTNLTAMESGRETINAGSLTVAVVFASAFNAAPAVVCTIEKSGNVQGCVAQSVTTTGFTIRRTSVAGAVGANWIAVGEKA